MLIKLVKSAILLSLVVVIGAGFWLKEHTENYGLTPLNLDSPVLFELKRGTSFLSFVNQLSKEGLIESVFKFRLYTRFKENVDQIKSGEYRLYPGENYQQLLTKVNKGEVIQRNVTLIEGLTLKDYLLLFKNHEELIHTLEGKTHKEIAELAGVPHENPEGWFFPDTYSFIKGSSDLEILKRAYQRTQQVLDDEWEKRAKELPITTPYEALILASIVEKETGAPEEREEIAGVFVRRLDKGMRLQTDPTVIYGMGDAYQGNIRRSDLNKKTAYNTYQINGLPPTPIASSGREAIHAALNPKPGKSLYFVAQGDGRHYFSSSLSEHNNAVNRYQKKRKANYSSSISAPRETQ